jgi:hypothetical protein
MAVARVALAMEAMGPDRVCGSPSSDQHTDPDRTVGGISMNGTPREEGPPPTPRLGCASKDPSRKQGLGRHVNYDHGTSLTPRCAGEARA